MQSHDTPSAPACKVNGCKNPRMARGWCSTHYRQWWLKQDGPLPPKIRQRNICTVDSCEAFVHGHGLCSRHYAERFLNVNALEPKKQCSIDECTKPATKRGWCAAHYQQWKRKGNPLHREEWEPIEDRFLRYAGPDPDTEACRLWTGPLDPKGYGLLNLGKRGSGYVLAHRYAYERTGNIIPNGWEIRHRCPARKRNCVNTRHLAIGTHDQNMKDMIDDGTVQRGEAHHAAKITEVIVREIRHLADNGESYGTIARQFGLSTANVSLIVRRMAWKHVT